MKIRTQLMVGMVIFAILLIAVSGLFLTTNRQQEQLVSQEAIAMDIVREVGELGYLSDDYILYRESRQEERWNAKFASLSAHIDNLSVDTPEEQGIASNLENSLSNARAIFDDIALSPVTPPNSEYVQLSWSRMAVQTQGMVFDAGRLSSLYRAQIDDLQGTRTLLIFVLMGGFTALLLTSYFLFYRRTLVSIARLQEGSRIIGSGDLAHVIEEKEDDEISELARSLNRMTSDLKHVLATKTDLEREITRRQEAEQMLVQANIQLEIRRGSLIQQNRDLNQLNEKLLAIQEELHHRVDELVQVQEDLRTSEERYRNLFEKMTEGFAVHEIISDDRGVPIDYRFLEINPAFEQLTGLKREDALGRRVSEVLPGIEPTWIDRYGAVALTGRPDQFESYTAALGRYYQVFAYSPSHGQFAVIFNDITERKRAQEALQQSEARLRRLYESGLMGIVFWNREGMITEANDEFLRWSGTPGRIFGKVTWIGSR
jgi:PAS domain S-box